jgi:hypothetical protein
MWGPEPQHPPLFQPKDGPTVQKERKNLRGPWSRAGATRSNEHKVLFTLWSSAALANFDITCHYNSPSSENIPRTFRRKAQRFLSTLCLCTGGKSNAKSLKRSFYFFSWVLGNPTKLSPVTYLPAEDLFLFSFCLTQFLSDLTFWLVW